MLFASYHPKTKCVEKFHNPWPPETHFPFSGLFLLIEGLQANTAQLCKSWQPHLVSAENTMGLLLQFIMQIAVVPRKPTLFMQLNCLQAYLYLNNGLAWVLFVSAGTKHLSRLFLLSTHICKLVLWKGLTDSFLCKDSFLCSNEFSTHEAHYQGLRKIKTLSKHLMHFGQQYRNTKMQKLWCFLKCCRYFSYVLKKKKKE